MRNEETRVTKQTAGASRWEAPRSPLAPAMVEICNELARTRREQLESYTLAELAERAAVRAGPMWYI